MAMSESDLLDLYGRHAVVEGGLAQLQEIALGRTVSLWRLISDDHGRYSEDAAARFADAMARKCTAVRRLRNICRVEGMTWGEMVALQESADEGARLAAEFPDVPEPLDTDDTNGDWISSDDDIEGPSWQYGDAIRETDDGTQAMLADLFYCAVRIAAQNPEFPLNHDDEHSVFFDFAYMPAADSEGKDYAGWLDRALTKREFDLDEFDDPPCEADDAAMRMAQYYALLSGCELTYVPGDVRAREESWDFNPDSYEIRCRDQCERYTQWRDGFINPDEFIARYERFRRMWEKRGLPEGLDMDVYRAFDLTLAELGISPLALGDPRLATIRGLLQSVRKQLEELVGDATPNTVPSNGEPRPQEDGR